MRRRALLASSKMGGNKIENRCTVTFTRLDRPIYTFDYPVASDVTINCVSTSGDFSLIISKGNTTITGPLLQDAENPITSIDPSEDAIYIYTW